MPKLNSKELEEECPIENEQIRHPCFECGEVGCYRYAPYDFGNNWEESERWRCHTHGSKYHNDPEWDYINND